MFGTIMTCMLTWDKMGLNWFEKLSEAFWATQPLTYRIHQGSITSFFLFFNMKPLFLFLISFALVLES